MNFLESPKANGYRGPCAKKRVRCVLIREGKIVGSGENWCLNPQSLCPRQPGEGYEKCASICQQMGHAQEIALFAAGEHAKGADAILDGIDYYCPKCQRELFRAGVRGLTLASAAVEELPHEQDVDPHAWFSADELATFAFPGYPRSGRRMRDRVRAEGWKARAVPSAGKKGFKLEYTPPAELLRLINAHKALESALAPRHPQFRAIRAQQGRS